ncbi:hypothetical protein P3X46_024978 [Hevea brasiliensis]|uniref:F-box domain-containing protein n=2 Tax=Hevea brasiliensis TaxID=3981 RepID=A0ABQ9L5N5_HEVBR|nr:hypothetical protein P3X46_024978 [Hevea brasiliensis]
MQPPYLILFRLRKETEGKGATKMSDYIPKEVLIEIFLRLPVKSLLRCRCVCKSWYSLISNQNFISLHTRNTIESSSKNKNRDYLLLRHYSRVDKKERFTLHLDDDDLFGKYQELDFPLNSSWDYFEIVGSCNGIVCLTDNHSHILKRIVLWNPSIGLSVTLPLQRFSYRVSNVILGFGFDSWTNDYKVIRIVYYSTDGGSLMVPPDVEIFELSKGAWRINNSASSPAYVVSKYSSQTVLEGAIHWVGYYNPRGLTIAVFAVHDEEFKEFKMPDEIVTTNVQHLSVMLCSQLLSLIQYRKRTGHLCYESCSIWVMNEYGVHDSWNKLFNVVVPGGLGKTLGLRNNVEVLLVGADGELISYDPWNQRVKRLGINGESCSFYADLYMESLVLLKGKKGVLVHSISGTATI